jgi:UDP-3-O-[3-hydroxymyristoyl] glucosamine N-acyltransferase
MEKLIISQILKILPNAKFIGNSECEIEGVDSLENYQSALGKLFWLADGFFEKYEHRITENIGLLVLTEQSYNRLLVKPLNALIVDNPKLAFQKILSVFFGRKIEEKVEHSAYIHPSAKIGAGSYIGRNVVIERDVAIGENCFVGHNSVILANTKIGNKVTIGCNCTIGGDGFGYAMEEKGEYVQLPHLGNVVIEDNVTIHNNVCIDRAVMGSTILEKNVKVDNHVHVAHGVVIGENSLVIAHAMIGGSTKIGKNCWIAPSASILNKLCIGDEAVIGLGAVVVKNVSEKSVMIGNPAKNKNS